MEMSGSALVTTAALLAVQVAQGRSAEQIECLGAFFTCLGENLELLAQRQSQNGPEELERKI